MIYNPIRLSAYIDKRSHDLVVSPPFLKSNFHVAGQSVSRLSLSFAAGAGLGIDLRNACVL